MVRQTYGGLGSQASAAEAFQGLAPCVRALLDLRRGFPPMSADHAAVGVALDGLQTAAYHFTRRRYFYADLEAEAARGEAPVDGRGLDPADVAAAFAALTPCADRLRALRLRCRPLGGDYLALHIALQGLETAAFHFTRQADVYGARSDAAGPAGGAS